MKRLNVGVIGLGRLGRVYARDLAGRIPETKLVAVADPIGNLAEEVAAEFDVPRCKEAHKVMLIGKNGEKLKEIATQARLDMEKMFGAKVFLEVWIKVRSGWADSPQMLKSLGYE